MSKLHPLFEALIAPMRPHTCETQDCWCEEGACTNCGARPELREACEYECGRDIHTEERHGRRARNGSATNGDVVLDREVA